jgi:hypothetical protein
MRGVPASLSVTFCSLTAPEGAGRQRHHLRKLRCLAFLGLRLVHGHTGSSYASPWLSCRALAALRRIRLGARSARSTRRTCTARCRQERVCPAPSRPRARRSPSREIDRHHQVRPAHHLGHPLHLEPSGWVRQGVLPARKAGRGYVVSDAAVAALGADRRLGSEPVRSIRVRDWAAQAQGLYAGNRAGYQRADRRGYPAGCRAGWRPGPRGPGGYSFSPPPST